MKYKFFFLLFIISKVFYSQGITNSDEKETIKPTFFQFDVSVPLKANINRSQTNPDGSKNDTSWFIPNGIGAKFGYGFQYQKWIGLSLHSGIDWISNYKLVAVPVFGNFRISPGFGNGTRITLQYGYGKGFALGRGNLQGNYQKISLGIETDDDLIIFIEASGYDFNVNNQKSTGSVSLGLALRTF